MAATRETALKNLAKSKGRPKGSRNKVPGDMVSEILRITGELEKKGKGLQACALQNPKWFYENFLKAVLPKVEKHEISGKDGSPITFIMDFSGTK